MSTNTGAKRNEDVADKATPSENGTNTEFVQNSQFSAVAAAARSPLPKWGSESVDIREERQDQAIALFEAELHANFVAGFRKFTPSVTDEELLAHRDYYRQPRQQRMQTVIDGVAQDVVVFFNPEETPAYSAVDAKFVDCLARGVVANTTKTFAAAAAALEIPRKKKPKHHDNDHVLSTRCGMPMEDQLYSMEVVSARERGDTGSDGCGKHDGSSSDGENDSSDEDYD